MTDFDDDVLSSELAEFAPTDKKGGRPAREERIIAGFEEIQRFVEKNGRPPRHGEGRDIFERLYAVRLDRIRALDECRILVQPLDHQGLLAAASGDEQSEGIDDDELLAELEGLDDSSAITSLTHVRSSAEKQAAEEIANRTPCKDFDKFKPLFDKVESDLKSGLREAVQIVKNPPVFAGDFFIVEGQTAYVAEVGPTFTDQHGQPDARLRVIYSNRTENNLLLRSLQRAFYRDEKSRRIIDPNALSLFTDQKSDDDVLSGTIYVLRSLSDHPFISEHRELIHKIGVTSGKVETRIANARLDSTYLLADVEVVATYQLADINPIKLEALFHRVFAPAQLDLTLYDRFNNPVHPREWFLVPLHVIDEAVDRIRDGTITTLTYDPTQARLV
jgi:hypothetical protein